MPLPVINSSENQSDKDIVKVCQGHVCGAREADDIYDELKKNYDGSDVQVVHCPCTGHCTDANNVYVNEDVLHWQQAKRVVDTVERKLSAQRRAKADAESPISSDDADDLLGI